MELAYVVAAKDAHFRRTTMKDWLIVRENYVVFEDDPSTRVLLTVDDLTADDWETDVTAEQMLADDVDETMDIVLRALADSKSKFSNAALEKLSRHREKLMAVLKEKSKGGDKVKKRPQLAGRGGPLDDGPDYE